MGAQLRVYRGKAASASVTKKITSAMELIAASRIVRAREKCGAFAPYAAALSRAVSTVLSYSDERHPLITQIEHPRRSAILVFASDRGLAGSFNAQVMNEAVQLGDNLTERSIETDYYLIGRKAVNFFNFRKIPFVQSWIGSSERPTFEMAQEISRTIFSCFLPARQDNKHDLGAQVVEAENIDMPHTPNMGDMQNNTFRRKVDEVYIVFNRFVNLVNQVPTAFRLIPMEVVDEVSSSSNIQREHDRPVLPLYSFEPDVTSVLDELLKEYVESRVFDTLLQSATAKHAATQRAMKSASDNADKLIEKYTRLANNARQAEITQQISEIIGGAGALDSG
ncbi:F0F1 ATP synthase subunit gamma [Tropheryma whipplei]|uniref:F0F1 ATP synthase subunit gamma n=1 Tax=Tropheryma whipplei TaxID=2039 RepID=UPI0004B08E73|nr:F0F1 ATP synthase subunit gamma [Tropheryma whipplei]